MKKFSIHPISVIIWIWLFFMLGIKSVFSYFFAILLHELGHYIVAKKLGYQLKKFSFSPYGVSLSYGDFNYKDEILIALAGPVVNLFSILILSGIWWIFPNTYFFTDNFAIISLILALVNFLPAYPLDGGRVFISISRGIFQEKTSKKITIFFNCLFSLVFTILFVVFMFIDFNPTFLMLAIFLIVGILDFEFETKYQKINVFYKKNRNFVKINPVFINFDVKIGDLLKRMQTSKAQIFFAELKNGKVVTLSEKMIVNLSMVYPIDATLEEIFCQ